LTGESSQAVRIAAIGDLHIRTQSPEHLEADLIALEGQVDLLVITGDITESGRIPEVEVAARLLAPVRVPMVGVLGNHDRRGLRRTAMRRMLEDSGLVLLDGDSRDFAFRDGLTVGVAGVSGTGGGFWLDEADAEVGSRLRQAVSVKARRESIRLKKALDTLRRRGPDVAIAVMHFSPTTTTLGEEPVLKHWMLGNSYLGRIIDEEDVDLVLHGHAHLGNRDGETSGGTPVRNVALQVTGGISVFEVAPGKQVRSIGDSPEPPECRHSETSRIRMLDMIRND